MRTDRAWVAVLVALAGATLLGGCASEPKPRPATLDPSSPAAAESPPLRVTSMGDGGVSLSSRPTGGDAVDTSKEPSTSAGHPHEHPETPPAEHLTYTCPMHPEVVSDQPGSCPKCGMKLVPKERAGGKK